MKKVEIYDNYTSTLATECTGIVTVQESNLSETDAIVVVQALYESSKTLGVYIDKIIKLNEGYAELKINLPDGKFLNRVIYTADI